jgi:hypothetical protein
MGLPSLEDNQRGYNNSDVTRLVENFRGKQFYLLHGNADDNVHYLQAMELSRALELANILFRQQVGILVCQHCYASKGKGKVNPVQAVEALRVARG